MNNLRGAIVSYATYVELLQGVESKNDMKIVERLLQGYEIEWGGESINRKSVEILKTYHYAYGIEVMDAVIAATALLRGYILVTENVKHFRQIKGLKVNKITEVVE